MNISSDKSDFKLQGLPSGRDYLVVVKAFNPKGSSKEYYLEGVALKVAENKISKFPLVKYL